jgi:hypothetical protein
MDMLGGDAGSEAGAGVVGLYMWNEKEKIDVGQGGQISGSEESRTLTANKGGGWSGPWIWFLAVACKPHELDAPWSLAPFSPN